MRFIYQGRKKYVRPAAVLQDWTKIYSPKEMIHLFLLLSLDLCRDDDDMDYFIDDPLAEAVVEIRRWQSECNRGGNDKELRKVLRKGHTDYIKYVS